jgi:succinyl-diaminopimelate desuccinylase
MAVPQSSHIDGPDVIALLSRLVSIESCDPPGNELPIALMLKDYLQSAGIVGEVDEFAPGRANLLARLRGTGTKPALVFSAHLDTVPTGREPWEDLPFSGAVRGGRVYGRGAADMKSGLAAMLVAFLSIAKQKEPLAGDLVLAFSAGESSSCVGAKRIVERGELANAGALLVGEPTSLSIVTAEMAVLWARFSTRGTTGHVSGGGGDNAITRLIKFLPTLAEVQLPSPDHPLVPKPTLCIGTIAGGSAINITPDYCQADVDIRLRPGTSLQSVVECLRQHASSGIELAVLDFKPAVETQTDHPFLQVCISACAAQRDVVPTIAGVSYYSDATVYATAYDIPFAIIGPGMLGMSGCANEFVEVQSVHDAVSIYQRIATQWLCQ